MRISIEKLSFGGSGVGKINGKVCFVPYSCPGDELSVRVTAEKRSYLTAAIVDIITPSIDRISPPCPLFGSCGGCDWQHISYSRQLSEKRRIFSDALWRGARVPGELIGDVAPSPEIYGYRGRVQLKLNAASGRLRIGFYRQGTHFVEDIQQGCPIAAPVINQILATLRKILPFFPEPSKIPRINIDSAEHGTVVIVSYTGNDRNGAVEFFKHRRAELENVTGFFLQTGKKLTLLKVFGDGLLEYSLKLESAEARSCSLAYKPGGFAQVNAAQNTALLQLVGCSADCNGHNRILDLYCGNGNFSLPLAASATSITGIEEYEDSILAALDNARRNGVKNAEFICGDAGRCVKRLVADNRNFDVIILDPPRSGAADVLADMVRLRPERIIYISCDPTTLARDCGTLSASGYSVFSTVPVDMFPQTYHLESATLLKRMSRETQ